MKTRDNILLKLNEIRTIYFKIPAGVEFKLDKNVINKDMLLIPASEIDELFEFFKEVNIISK